MSDEGRDPPPSAGRAVVLAVDDDAADLAVLRRELAKRYGVDYEVRALYRPPPRRSASSQDLRVNGGPVALVLAGHWMTETPGTDLLGTRPRPPPDRQERLARHLG